MVLPLKGWFIDGRWVGFSRNDVLLFHAKAQRRKGFNGCSARQFEPSHYNNIATHEDDYWGNDKARSADIMVEIYQ